MKVVRASQRYIDILLPVIGLSVILGFFLWLPDSAAAWTLRRYFLLSSGGLAIAYLLLRRPAVELSSWLKWGLLFFLMLSSLTLLSRGMGQSLLAPTSIHPALLSLYASFSVGFLWLQCRRTLSAFKWIYISVLLFGFANLVLWLPHWFTDRLGAWGIQINYAAYLFTLGLGIGCYLFKKRGVSQKWLIFGQFFLLIVVLLTMSRIEISVALVCFGLFIWLLGRHISKKIAFSFAICTLIVSGTILLSPLFGRVHNTHYFSESVRYRLELVQAALPTNKRQLLFGQGVTGVESNIGQQGQHYALLAPDLSRGWHFESSHNYIVDLAVERGLGVASVFIVLVIIAIVCGAHNWAAQEQRLLLGLFAITLVFLLFNNINIEIEIVLWSCLIALLAKKKSLPETKQPLKD